MTLFSEQNIKDVKFNPFALQNRWMLVTATKPDGTVNTMTASWGGFGTMWNKDVAFVVIRPQRYTKEFVDSAESFSLTFFNKSYNKALAYLGKASGRDGDKIAKEGLTIIHNEGIPYFEECEVALFAKKLYAQPMEGESFLDKNIITRWFPENDFHILYIAEITQILKKDNSSSDELNSYFL